MGYLLDPQQERSLRLQDVVQISKLLERRWLSFL